MFLVDFGRRMGSGRVLIPGRSAALGRSRPRPDAKVGEDGVNKAQV